METFNVLRAAVLLLFAVYVTGQYYGGQEHVLMENQCKCVRVTSRFVPSQEDPNEEILQRNIEITCKKCDPVEIEIGGEPILVSQGSCSKPDEDSCYTYDRNKCYTTKVPFTFNGKTTMKEVSLNPESCYE